MTKTIQVLPQFFVGLMFLLFGFIGNTNAAVPVAPKLLAPGKQAANSVLTYKWVPVARANNYQLWVTDSTGRRIAKRYRKAKVCKSATNQCSVKLNIALAPGNVHWRVRAKNADGWGAWSRSRLTTVTPKMETFANALEVGDRYDYFTEAKVGGLLFNDMWRVLHERNARCWISEYSTLTQYQFYEDNSFLPGPLYRYSGIDVSVGQLTVYSIGWYYRPSSNVPLRAAYVNAGIGDFLLVLADDNTFVEAFWHNGNYLVVTPFHVGNQCL